eukprot:2651753-Prymnesium_polylepis.1
MTVRRLAISAITRAKQQVRSGWCTERWHSGRLHCKAMPKTRLPAACQRATANAGPSDLSQPAIIEGAMQAWPEPACWSLESILTQYAATELVAGTDDEDYAVTMRIDAYMEYAASQQDDAPLYLFDDAALDLPELHPLAEAYATPPCFPFDFLEALGSERPPYRWILIGAARAGTALHVDPHATAAYNTLVSGAKRWLLFPPSTDPAVLFREAMEEDLEAVQWLHECYPHLPKETNGFDLIQQPGQTVFVPHGWWHMVVNLETSVAVTHNFVGPHNVEAAHAALHAEAPELAARWLERMRSDPELSRLLP